MHDEKYKLRYLPLFYEDIDEKVTYIVDELKNPQAANNYVIYYVVIDDNPDDLIMEVRRFLYAGQDREKIV